MEKSSNRFTVLLFATAIFVSAFLLFQVQPIMGKFILPWFGGSPGVWTTCMLVFQVLLFGGYAYAHLLSRFLTLPRQVLLHCSLLAIAILSLPITPTPDWKPIGTESPTWMIMLLLVAKIGAPYFLLSSTGPLLQSWLGQSNVLAAPYRLYSLSNVGSMLALLSFPFVIEPALSSTQQSIAWSFGFGAFVVICAVSGWVLTRTPSAVATSIDSNADSNDATSPTQPNATDDSQYLAWFTLSCLASVMLLATTNQVCLDTGVIPFLWVVPLAIYLLSFILTFDSDRWYRRRPLIMLSTISFLALYLFKLFETKVPLPVELLLYFTGLFAACMVCHGELVSLKPHPKKLTSFYMTMSAGGASGGIFVGLIAPQIFQSYIEWQLSLLGCILLFLNVYLQSNNYWRTKLPMWKKATGFATIAIVAVIWVSISNSVANRQLVAKRNFYGVLSVNDSQDEKTGEPMRNLVHGRIVHGSQLQRPESTHTPTTYYSESSGVGLTLRNHHNGQQRNVGIVGLGAGTLAVYGAPNDNFRFYEINPHVIEFAQEYFTFLKDSKANIQLVLGDARLTLEREPPQNFDVLVLDAFSGDAIPVHLLTREAMEIYKKHLKPDGILAIHISNLYFDLDPIISGLAAGESLRTCVVSGATDTTTAAYSSTWVLLANDDKELQVAIGQENKVNPAGKPVFWTDDRSNLFEALR